MATPEDRRIIAVGSGKGGVGKSLMAANFSIALARQGRRVILVDADLGGANCHTCLGMDPPTITLSSFITREVSSLERVVVPTGMAGLSLLSGASDLLDAANPHHAQKMRLLRHLVTLEFDDLVLDLGAGTHNNVLDFYLLAEHGILVIAPEPTSEENAYRFLKAAYLRRLRNVQRVYGIKEVLDRAVDSFRARGFISTPREVVETVRRMDPEIGRIVSDEMTRFRPHLLVNQSRGVEDERMGQRISHACRHLLGIELVYVGAVPYDDTVWKTLRRQRPLLPAAPDCPATVAIEAIVGAAFGQQTPNRDWSPAQPLFRHVGLDEAHRDALAPSSAKPAERTAPLADPDGDPPPLSTTRPEETPPPPSVDLDVEAGEGSGESAQVTPLPEPPAEVELVAESPRGDADTSGAAGDPEDRGSEGPRDTARRTPISMAEGVGEPTPMAGVSGRCSPPAGIELPEEGESLGGELLGEVRRALGLEIKDVSATTKIPRDKIVAIEANDFAAFAARVYLRGFVFQFARSLGLDGARVARAYMRQIDPDSSSARPGTAKPRGNPTS